MSALFVVLPCFREAAGLDRFVARLQAALSGAGELSASKRTLVLVDDGSDDATWAVIRRLAGSPEGWRIHGVRLARNFGHQAAIVAGLDAVRLRLGCREDDTVVLMDADGQHPPELIPRMLEARAGGYHHVQMVRQDRAESGGWVKRVSSRLFYGLFSRLSGLTLRPGSSDFRALSGHALFQYGRFEETVRFNRGLFAWLGFETAYLPYAPEARLAGASSYSLRQMLSLGLKGITYFSSKPLVITNLLVFGLGLVSCAAYGVVELYRLVVLKVHFVPGWASIVFVVTGWGTLLALNQFLIAQYLARVFDEIKRRPAYIVAAETPPGDPGR